MVKTEGEGFPKPVPMERYLLTNWNSTLFYSVVSMYGRSEIMRTTTDRREAIVYDRKTVMNAIDTLRDRGIKVKCSKVISEDLHTLLDMQL